MRKQIILHTGYEKPIHVLLEDGQDVASLEEDLMEAAKTGTIVSVNGSVGGDKKGIVYINPSRALLWEIKDVSNLRVGSVR